MSTAFTWLRRERRRLAGGDLSTSNASPRPRTDEISSPGASHEITVFALDPSSPFSTEEIAAGASVARLTPLNISMQVDDLTDDECRVLVTLIARAMAHGHLPAEPPFPNPVEEPVWRSSIDHTITHIKLGGHPTASA